MTKGSKMLYGFVNPLCVVDLENTNIRQIGPCIHEHKRKGAIHELLNQFLLDAEGHDGDPVDTALQHTAEQRLSTSSFMVRGADEDLVALLYGQVFELLHKFGKEWIGDFRNHETKNAASS